MLFPRVCTAPSPRADAVVARVRPARGSDVLIAGLPGVPDGISRSPDGGFWVGLVVPLSPFMRLLGPHPWLRQLASHFIRSLAPYTIKRWGAALKLNAAGHPVRTLYDLDGSRVSTVSAITEHGGRLFFGNLGGDYVSFLDLAAGDES